MRASKGKAILEGGKSMGQFGSNCSSIAGVNSMNVRCLQCLSFVRPASTNMSSNYNAKALSN